MSSSSAMRMQRLATTEGQFRLSIPRSHAAYEALIDLFAADLRVQSTRFGKTSRLAILAQPPRIPYWSWVEKADQVMSILHPHRTENGFVFTWPLIGHILHLCAATVPPAT